MKNPSTDPRCEAGADPQTPGADIPASDASTHPTPSEAPCTPPDPRSGAQARPGSPDRSEAQSQAARLNGAKSRGPITPEGKRNSSANSRRHGILSRCIVLPSENRQDFLNFLASLQGTFQPANEATQALVEIMAVSHWRQQRIWAMETSGFQDEIENHPADLRPSLRAAKAFRSLADQSKTLQLLDRYETRFYRQFTRSLRLLLHLGGPGAAPQPGLQPGFPPDPEPESQPETPPPMPPPPAAPEPQDFQTNPASDTKQEEIAETPALPQTPPEPLAAPPAIQNRGVVRRCRNRRPAPRPSSAFPIAQFFPRRAVSFPLPLGNNPVMALATTNRAPAPPLRPHRGAATPARILSDRPPFPPSKSLEPVPRFAGNIRLTEDRILGEIGDIVLPKTPRSLTAALALAAGIAAAQTAPPPADSRPVYEAVDIKPNTSGSQSTSSHGSRSQVLMQNMSLRQLLERALGVKSYQLTGPAWMDNTRFDIAAKYPIGATTDERSHMLRILLEGRFGLQLHDEMHDMPGYALVVGKGGIKAKPEQTPDGIDSHGDGKIVKFKAQGVTMSDLAEYLARRLNLIVVDKTEAAGLFNFEMQWDPQQDNLKVTDPDPGPSIFNELQDKVGVKLQAAKVPVQVFVVDKLERTPSGN